MITYLKVRNLAIVEEFAIEPGAGLNVLTGETGAGKSLLIDSLELLRGARGSTDAIRAGADRMTAEAVFHLPAEAAAAIEALGVEMERAGDGVELIVKREVATNGRGRVLINGSPLPVRDLGAAMDAVLEIHGQHESHNRVAGQGYRELLDEFAGDAALLEQTRSATARCGSTSSSIKSMRSPRPDAIRPRRRRCAASEACWPMRASWPRRRAARSA